MSPSQSHRKQFPKRIITRVSRKISKVLTTQKIESVTEWTWSGAGFVRESPSERQLAVPNRLQLYKRARYYDPATGEFISRDPLGYVDGMSLYRGYFVPSGVDPSGMESVKHVVSKESCNGSVFSWKIKHQLVNGLPGIGNDERDTHYALVQRLCFYRQWANCEKDDDGCCRVNPTVDKWEGGCVYEVLPTRVSFAPAKGHWISTKNGYDGIDTIAWETPVPKAGCGTIGTVQIQSSLYLIPLLDVHREWLSMQGKKANNDKVAVRGGNVRVNSVLRDPSILDGMIPESVLNGSGSWDLCSAQKLEEGGVGFPPPTCHVSSKVSDTSELPKNVKPAAPGNLVAEF